ncbi:MAG: C40 family peptidase [Sediminibacterium sp.]|nr:C40 family peptidase [Sediminibacterium sp.]MDP3129125.1 C40 family peptidase [Sediminibacterium sp.]MDP3667617.1 C40 family peptidase [Sediminibacterium sp.]
MAFVICIVPFAPLRKEDNHRSEMISQVLFGETAELLEEGKSFSRIRCLYDGYEGWCQTGQLTGIEDSVAENSPEALTAEWDTVILLNNHPMHLPLGSSLGILQRGKAMLGKYRISYNGEMLHPAVALFSADAITSLAMQFLNTPYVWGGRSVMGIDCSGFVQQLFRFFNRRLPRDAYQQAESGELVGFLQEVRCGDLAYFDNEEGKIIHVGLLLNSDTIIHASGKVRIDKIDNMGIVNSDTGERTHRLRIIKRYFQH